MFCTMNINNKRLFNIAILIIKKIIYSVYDGANYFIGRYIEYSFISKVFLDGIFILT